MINQMNNPAIKVSAICLKRIPNYDTGYAPLCSHTKILSTFYPATLKYGPIGFKYGPELSLTRDILSTILEFFKGDLDRL